MTVDTDRLPYRQMLFFWSKTDTKNSANISHGGANAMLHVGAHIETTSVEDLVLAMTTSAMTTWMQPQFDRSSLAGRC